MVQDRDDIEKKKKKFIMDGVRTVVFHILD